MTKHTGETLREYWSEYEGHENKFWIALAAEWNALQGKLNERDAEIARLVGALQSIANNTCCATCQESAQVARDALWPKAMARAAIDAAREPQT